MLGLHFLALAAARSLAGGWSEAPASAKITALAQYSLRSLAEEFCASSNADWPQVPAAPLVTGPRGEVCGTCDKGGILTECHGCGYSFHFQCCDRERQPPGGDVAFYCGHADCKGSYWRSLCGFVPQPVPVDTFECVVCKDDLNVGLKCELAGCTCRTDRTCVDCVHELVLRMPEGDTKRECPTCCAKTTGIVRPGSSVPQLYSEMQSNGIDVDLFEPVGNAVRRGKAAHEYDDEIDDDAAHK